MARREAIHEPTWSDIVRFMTRVQVDSLTGCWNWIGSTIGREREYGGFSMRSTPGIYAHRWAYFVAYGEIPEGKELDHFVCSNKRCVFVLHLKAVTHRENTLRSDAPPGINSRKTHCKNGHEYTEESTWRYVSKDGKNMRHCRICWKKPFRVQRKKGKVA